MGNVPLQSFVEHFKKLGEKSIDCDDCCDEYLI
jgi:hypothetical protein